MENTYKCQINEALFNVQDYKNIPSTYTLKKDNDSDPEVYPSTFPVRKCVAPSVECT